MNAGGAYGGGKAGASFDVVTFVQRPQVILRALCWVSHKLINFNVSVYSLLCHQIFVGTYKKQNKSVFIIDFSEKDIHYQAEQVSARNRNIHLVYNVRHTIIIFTLYLYILHNPMVMKYAQKKKNNSPMLTSVYS